MFAHNLISALVIVVLSVCVSRAETNIDNACTVTNTTFIALDNICIHSDHAGACGAPGADVWNVVLPSSSDCEALCCKHRDICAAYIWYASYKGTCCTGTGCTGMITTPPSDPGAPCCWLKRAVSPANKWSNDPYCTKAAVAYVPGEI